MQIRQHVITSVINGVHFVQKIMFNIDDIKQPEVTIESRQLRSNLMKIGELAKMALCSVETIRYYEKEALLPQTVRSEGICLYALCRGNVPNDRLDVNVGLAWS